MASPEEAAAAAAAATAAAATAAAAAGNWTTGLEGELLGHAQTLGWDKMKPDEAARAAVKSHLEARKYIGVPETQIVRLPDAKAAPEAWNSVWQKLGAPADKKDYDFTAVKFKDGTALDAPFSDFLRGQAYEMHLTKDNATKFANALVSNMDAADAAEQTISAANLLQEKAQLQQSWGSRADLNLQLAKRSAEIMGFTAEQISALEGQVGYAKTMQAFLTMAPKLGEDVFIGLKDGAGNGGVLTAEQAIAKIEALKGDKAWTDRYLAGGEAEVREMRALQSIKTSQ